MAKRDDKERDKGKRSLKDDPDDQEKSTSRFVKERFDRGLSSTREAVENYWMNHAFLKGHQWLWYNTTHRYVEPLPRDPDRVRATVNRLLPDSRTIISKLTQQNLDFDVLPTAADDATLRGAALSESALEDVRLAHKWEVIRVRNLWATWKGGVAAICVDWNPHGGSPITATSAQKGTKDNSRETVFSGDTVETPLAIPEFVVEPGAKDAETARWWIKAQALPPEEVQATFGLEEKPEPDATGGMSPFRRRLVAENYNTEQVDLTLVLTYYERPNGLCKEGRIVTLVNDRVMHEGKWPFPFKDRLNLVCTYETDPDNDWLGDTVLSQARYIQVLYNAAWSNIQEHMKDAGNARLAVPQSSMNLMDSMSDYPGEAVVYPDGMAPPGFITPPVMPQWWVDHPDKLRQEIDDMLGVHDVSRGRAPANIESGYGLSILSEQDNTPMGKMASSMAGAWSRLACMVLEIYGHNVKSKRQSVVSTPGLPAETADWTGKDLEKQYRAEVPLDAVLPRSRAAQLEVAREMVQMGMVQDIETFSIVADLPGRRQLIDRMQPNVAKARRENALMAMGHERVPAVFDDHAQHIAEHNVFRLSEKWDRLTDDVRELVNLHIQAHETLAAEALGAQRAQAAVDPLTAAVPRGTGAGIPPEMIPGEALDPNNLPGAVDGMMPAEDPLMDGELPSPEEMAMIEGMPL